MTEFSRKRGDALKNKTCFSCQQECKLAVLDSPGASSAGKDTVEALHFFECRGHGGCAAVICELCQKARVSDFEAQPMLFIHKLTQERVFAEFLDNLEQYSTCYDEGEEVDSEAAKRSSYASMRPEFEQSPRTSHIVNIQQKMSESVAGQMSP